MDPTIKQILGLREDEENSDGKIEQEAAVYLTPEQIDDSSGAHCGACIFFNAKRSECLLTSPAACNAKHGVCAAFLGGNSIFKNEGTPLKLLPKTSAGYIQSGPTKCAICEYWGGKTKDDPDANIHEKAECEKVSGTIQSGGCCNLWEKC
jgi:hypothetical protein